MTLSAVETIRRRIFLYAICAYAKKYAVFLCFAEAKTVFNLEKRVYYIPTEYNIYAKGADYG